MAATQCAELNDLRSLPGDFSLELFNSKSLTIRSKERGYNYFIVKPERVDSNRRVYISARSYRSVRKSETPHRLNMEVSTADHNITDSSCSCVVGLSGTCSHILGLVYTLIHYQQQGLKEVPASTSCTSLPQQWHKPRGSKIKPKSVVSMILAKAKTQKRKRKPIITRARKQRLISPTNKDIKKLKQNMPCSALAYLVDENNGVTKTDWGTTQTGS